MHYQVQLDSFQGPLELLLELIEKEELDISDVSLARVTDQFLAFLSHFEEKKPEHLAEFLVVAAKLILLKSKTLLPSFAVSEEEQKEISDLKEKLEAYKRVREAARHIARLERKHRLSFERPSGLKGVRVFAPPQRVTAETLFVAMQEVERERARQAEYALPEVERIDFIVSFEEKIKDIKMRLERNLKESFSALYDASAKINVIVAFLAILELVKQRFVRVEQKELFGEIQLVKHERES